MALKKFTKDGRPLLKMKELMEQSGVPKATVLHYINEGLLPQPEEKSRNMAWYHPDCVEKILFIKSVQARYRLPLSSIKGLMREREKGRFTEILVELHDSLFGRSDSRDLSLEEFCKASGLDPEAVEKWMEIGILIPKQEGKFDSEDLTIGRLLKQVEEGGSGPEDLAFYGEIASELSTREIEYRQKLTRDLPFDKDAALTLELSRNVRILRGYVMDRAFQLRILSLKGLKDDLSGAEDQSAEKK
ncbi:MAG: MerR family transcriptional regulator [Desulfobacteraceae bacterium]|nr:MerR family transcriptional regulator [Desulfobacteraceae bacterium]